MKCDALVLLLLFTAFAVGSSSPAEAAGGPAKPAFWRNLHVWRPTSRTATQQSQLFSPAQMKREGHRLGRQTVTALDRECKHLDGSIHDLLQVQRRLDDNLSQLKCLRAMNRQCAAHKTNKERKERNSSIHANGGVRALVRDYGWPLAAWYGTVWTATAVLCYGSIAVLQIDPVAQVLKPIDVRMGWTLCQRVSPAAGRWGAALVVNELLEPIRLPLVLATLQPILAANRQKSRTQSNSKT